MTDPTEPTFEELRQALLKAWHKVWEEGTTDKPFFDIPKEADNEPR